MRAIRHLCESGTCRQPRGPGPTSSRSALKPVTLRSHPNKATKVAANHGRRRCSGRYRPSNQSVAAPHNWLASQPATRPRTQPGGDSHQCASCRSVTRRGGRGVTSDASRDANRLSLLPRHAAQAPGCPGRIGPAGLSDGRSARPCTRARTMVPGQRRRRVVAGPRRHRSSRPEPLYAAAAPTCPRRSTPQLLPSWTSHRPVLASGAPAEWCHDAGLHRRKARRQDDKCRDRQNRKYMKCDACVHILTLAERQKDPPRKPQRRSRRDPAVFAIDSTRCMSEPDLAASGFTVSEVA